MRGLALTMATFAFATAAHADDLAPRAIDHDRIWYGWQTMTADAAFITAFALYPKWSGFTGDGTLLFVDVLAYTIVSPLIDALHDNVRSESIALRLGFPLIGSLLGLGIGTLLPPHCGSTGICLASDTPIWSAFDGALFGAGLASLIDGIAFAWKTREPKRDAASWTLTPFGVRGTF